MSDNHATDLEKLSQQSIWRCFMELSAIPRNSHEEDRVIDFIKKKATDLDLSWQNDAHNNLMVWVPASAGYETSPTTCLQAHVDMVCVATKGVEHDFTNDPIDVIREGNLLKANGTTLGADNGFGIAMMLAIMEGEDEHGPLELVFTTDEEDELSGANNLGFELTATYLINLDAEEDDSITVGCASATTIKAELSLAWQPVEQGDGVFQIKVSGLPSGHSGLVIHENRSNAIKVLTDLLIHFVPSIGLIEINGGLRDNVIPAEAMAIITVPKELENDLRTAIEQSNATISMKPLDVSATYILTKQSEIDLIALLKNLPHGVLKRHPELDSVETSANLAKITVSEKGVEILLSVRSCSQVGEDAVVLDIVNTFRTDFDPEEFGIEHLSPPWRPNLDSNLLAKAKKIYGIFYGKPPKINVMHAGLEAAILVQNYPSMEAISIGPNIFDVHTPQENIEIDSAERCWEFLTALLASL